MKKKHSTTYFEDDVDISDEKEIYNKANFYSTGKDVSLSLREPSSDMFMALYASSVCMSIESWRKVIPKLLAFIQEVEVEEGKL